MQELLFGSWGPQIIAYSQQHPWRVFAILLVGVQLLDLMFREQQSSSGEFGWFDFGDGDGGGDCDGGGGD
jgi:hypothetical protein